MSELKLENVFSNACCVIKLAWKYETISHRDGVWRRPEKFKSSILSLCHWNSMTTLKLNRKSRTQIDWDASNRTQLNLKLMKNFCSNELKQKHVYLCKSGIHRSWEAYLRINRRCYLQMKNQIAKCFC